MLPIKKAWGFTFIRGQEVNKTNIRQTNHFVHIPWCGERGKKHHVQLQFSPTIVAEGGFPVSATGGTTPVPAWRTRKS